MLVDRDKAIEACAKVCYDICEFGDPEHSYTASHCAAAIRQLTLEDCRVGDGFYSDELTAAMQCIKRQAREIESLSAQVAELRKDAESWRRRLKMSYAFFDGHAEGLKQVTLHILRLVNLAERLQREINAIDAAKESGDAS